jgi:hypothetical protein
MQILEKLNTKPKVMNITKENEWEGVLAFYINYTLSESFTFFSKIENYDDDDLYLFNYNQISMLNIRFSLLIVFPYFISILKYISFSIKFGFSKHPTNVIFILYVMQLSLPSL